MARNAFYNQYAEVKQEQNLVEDLIIEAIKIYGLDAYYLPRTHVNLDALYTEDTLTKFDDALELELYIKTYDGFLGQQEFLSKFGLQVDESITFTVAKKRFTQSLTESILTEYNHNVILENKDNLIKEQTYDYADILRPREGDLVYLPLAGYMYEIKFVEHIETFFQLGKLYTYEIKCDRYEYSSEVLDTDIAAIDGIETDLSADISINAEVEDVDETADNAYIESRITDQDILDMSETNPFGS
jgi:hypothetical protein